MGNPLSLLKMGLLVPLLLLSVSSVLSSSIPPLVATSGVLFNCVVENWGNGKDTAGPCILCFAEEQQTFLERAVSCSERYLPAAYEVCSEVFVTAVAEDQESVEDIFECFDDTLEKMTAERCLRIVPEGGDLVENLAEGALCLTEAKGNATHFIENFLGIEDQIKAERQSSAELVLLKEKKYLEPVFRECLEMKAVLETGEEVDDAVMRDIWLCFARTELRSLVSTCTYKLSISSVSTDNLLAVMDCGKEIADSWVQRHASIAQDHDLLAGNLVLVDEQV